MNMKRSVRIWLWLMIITAVPGALLSSAAAQTSSYGLKTSDIATVSIDAEGWLVGWGQSALENEATALIAYPVRFEPGATVWKVGDVAYCISGFTFATLPLAIPSVNPNWKDADFPPTDPKQPNRDLTWFVERVGRERVDASRLSSFYEGAGASVAEIERGRADINEFSAKDEQALIAKLRAKQLDFFNDTLANLNSSLYDSLGFSEIKLPPHLVRMARAFKGKVIPKGPQRTDLMLLNRCLIDQAWNEYNTSGKKIWLDQYQSSKIIPTKLFKEKSSPLFPLEIVVGGFSISQTAGAQNRVRALTLTEITQLQKNVDPRKLNGVKVANNNVRAFFPKEVRDEDLVPYALYEGPYGQNVLSQKGYWIGDGIAAEMNRQLGASWTKSLRPGDRFEAVLTQEQPRKVETGALTIKKFNIEIGESRGVNEFSIKVEFLGEWKYVNDIAFTAVNCNEVAYEKYGRDGRDRFGDIESLSINEADATCRLETRMVQKKRYRLKLNTNGMPLFPPRWENGFFMRFQMSGRLTEDGMNFGIIDVGSGQAIDFGTVKLLRTTR